MYLMVKLYNNHQDLWSLNILKFGDVDTSSLFRMKIVGVIDISITLKVRTMWYKKWIGIDGKINYKNVNSRKTKRIEDENLRFLPAPKSLLDIFLEDFFFFYLELIQI